MSDIKTTAIHACIPEDGIYEATHLAYFRSVLAKVNREMSEAYQQRLKITVASAQHDLVFVQKCAIRASSSAWLNMSASLR